jgi:hypothetical protein
VKGNSVDKRMRTVKYPLLLCNTVHNFFPTKPQCMNISNMARGEASSLKLIELIHMNKAFIVNVSEQ